jgi:GST-like protein
MIDLYTWSTPNGRKVSIMLEECALSYKVHPINIGKGEQHTPEFLAINPNNRIPAIVDSEGPGGKPLPLFESGAILIYLPEKTGKLIPKDVRARLICLQWLMFQMGGVGPMFGQAHHFIRNKEVVPYGIKRYTDETRRLYGVLQKRLSEAEYLAGAEYTIADIATFPWVARFEWHKVDLNDFPAVKAWYDKLYTRAAVKKGMAVPTPP